MFIFIFILGFFSFNGKYIDFEIIFRKFIFIMKYDAILLK